MADRSELLEAALEAYPEGLALLDLEGRVVFWNRAAEVITGYPGASLVGRPLCQAHEALISCPDYERAQNPRNGLLLGRGLLVHARHQNGCDLPVITRKVVLRDGLGERIGAAAVFHPAAQSTALPHGETSEGSEVQQSQAELQDRLEAACEAHLQEGIPLGVLWITVDQAEELRKTHGSRACEAMLENMERTLANALRAGEEIGRWGDDEFIILSPEARADVLANHARVLAGIARTADFHWWGDRVSLTVSVGAAEAEGAEPLAGLLGRAQAAMQTSVLAGGNQVALAPGRSECLPS